MAQPMGMEKSMDTERQTAIMEGRQPPMTEKNRDYSCFIPTPALAIIAD